MKNNTTLIIVISLGVLILGGIAMFFYTRSKNAGAAVDNAAIDAPPMSTQPAISLSGTRGADTKVDITIPSWMRNLQ